MGLEKIKKFINDGRYLELRMEKEKLHILKNTIREEQDQLNIKRMVWAELGVVGEFQIYKRFDYNSIEVKHILHNIGLMPLVSYIRGNNLTDEELDMIDHIFPRKKRYLRFYPNPKFKQCQNVPLFNTEINDLNLIEKVDLWRQSYRNFEQLNNSWNRERKIALTSPELSINTKFPLECGTFSILESPPIYRTDILIGFLDTETILKKAVVDIVKLEDFAARGFINFSDLKLFRKVVDVQRRYWLITLQKEKDKKVYLENRLKRLSMLSQI
ncbi:hypothetical protein MJA45_18865 [Paenibacillus aurantius]|uniref:Uncharacterized protein n=1 Tax=Paenibacillus aurantius TaxID=2918900 RepID=A0AA96LDF3_9BACL|nr:hypothetical protein [Paenibacillus aurantius]WNQ09677.1 hypothetical protein MJA45_18865 [Paenibacillus aurantius]